MTAPAPGDHQQQAAEVPGPWQQAIELRRRGGHNSVLHDELIAAALAAAEQRGARRITERMEQLAEHFDGRHEQCWENDANEVAYAYGIAADRIRAALAEGNNDTEEMGK